MLHEASFGDILYSPIVLFGLVALAIFVPMRWALGRTGLLRGFWHPALMELGAYLIILCLIVQFIA